MTVLLKFSYLLTFVFQLLVIYNLLCSTLSLWTMIGFIRGIIFHQGENTVVDRIYEIEGDPEYLSLPFELYALTKALELCDTLFMILKHKDRQITFLHVYHHASMLILSDMARQSHYNWPSIAVILGLNSAVHVPMYFYYFLSALNPGGTRPAWRQHLTECQILQFVIDCVFALYGYIYYTFCVYSLLYGFIMIILFSNFYFHAYIKPKSKKPT